MGLFRKNESEELLSLRKKYEKLESDYESLQKEYDKILNENFAMSSKMDYVEGLLDECGEMKDEWVEIIKEAKSARDQMNHILRALAKDGKENNEE